MAKSPKKAKNKAGMDGASAPSDASSDASSGASGRARAPSRAGATSDNGGVSGLAGWPPETKFRGRAPEVKAFDAVPGGAREPKWRRRAAERPDEILDAALALFSVQGYEPTSVDEVAARAGISKAGLYLYFDSKDALLRALIEREIAPFARALPGLVEEGKGDPKLTLTRIVLAMSTMFQNERAFAAAKVVLSVAPRFPEIAAYYRENVIDIVLAAFRHLIEEGMRRGIFRAVDPHVAARAILGPMLLKAMRQNLFGGGEEPRTGDPVLQQVDLVLKGFAA